MFFQAEDGIRELVRSRGLGDVYKRQGSDVGLAAKSENLDALELLPDGRLLLSTKGSFSLSLIHI